MKPTSRTTFVTATAFCAAICFALSPAPAAAAENPSENFFQKLIPSEPCNWGGFYIGFNNGATFNHFDLGKQMTDVNLEQQFYELVGETGDEVGIFTTFQTPGHSETDTETIGGMQTGFHLQFGHFVVGAEGSFIGNGSTAGSKFHDFQENELFLITEQQFVTADTEFTSVRKIETTWNGSLGANIGFAWNRFLFYGAGGAAFTDAHFNSWNIADTSFFGFIGDGGSPTPTGDAPRSRRAVTPNPPENFIGEIVSKKMRTQGDVLTGWYGGGGVDYALTNIVSVGVEYKHLDWGEVAEHLMGGNGPVFPGNGDVYLTADQVVFKVNILIGPIGH